MPKTRVRARIWGVWSQMKNRCYNKNAPNFKNYGARGIEVCEEWRNDFKAFRNWAYANGYDENAPKMQCTLDRINNDGNYEPENCRWVTSVKQHRNKRRNRMFTYKGDTRCMSEWAEILGVTRGFIQQRLRYGWDIDKIIETPPKRQMVLTFGGVTRSINEWSEITGIEANNIRARLKRGWECNEIFEIPIKKYQNRS